MGKGFLRRRKMAQMAKQVQEMQALVQDPQGAFQKLAGPLVKELQTARYQQNRLSALVCALIKQNGTGDPATVVLKRKDIDQFAGHRISILNETAVDDDGVDPEAEISFSFTAEPIEAPAPDVPMVNDLGNTPAAQAEMDAIAADHDAQIPQAEAQQDTQS